MNNMPELTAATYYLIKAFTDNLSTEDCDGYDSMRCAIKDNATLYVKYDETCNELIIRVKSNLPDNRRK